MVTQKKIYTTRDIADLTGIVYVENENIHTRQVYSSVYGRKIYLSSQIREYLFHKLNLRLLHGCLDYLLELDYSEFQYSYDLRCGYTCYFDIVIDNTLSFHQGYFSAYPICQFTSLMGDIDIGKTDRDMIRSKLNSSSNALEAMLDDQLLALKKHAKLMLKHRSFLDLLNDYITKPKP